MKAFFIKVKNWFLNHMPTRRRIIQFYTFLLYNANSKGYINGQIFKGNSKYVCVPGMNCYSCPGAIAACPLGALQNALYASNTTTAYYMFGIIGLFGLILGRTICGFLCPVGLGQELLHKIKTPKLRKSFATRVLSYLKYAILVVLVVALPIMYSITKTPVPGFCKYICPAGTFEGGIGLLLNPANQTGGRSMLNMLGPIFTWKFAVLCVIIVASVFMYRPFCRFLCPLGAIYGFFNRFALIGVKLDENECTNCGLCIQHCKMDIKHVGDHECINCGECISVCPAKAITWKGSKIFLRKNDVAQPAPIEEKPLVDIKSIHFSSPAPINTSSNNNLTPIAVGAGVSTSVALSTMDTNVNASNSNDDRESTKKSTEPKSPKHDNVFWMRFAAWMTALVVLLSALVYFNFFAKSSQIGELNVGDELPEFSVRLYGYDEEENYVLLEETFNSSDHLGEVMVINFWGTWCGPCVAELPHFNKVAKMYPQINVLAIHGSSTDDVPRWIETKEESPGSDIFWSSYSLIFAQDELNGEECKTFKMLGGGDNWPMTVIVGKDGRVSFIQQGGLSESALIKAIEEALK